MQEENYNQWNEIKKQAQNSELIWTIKVREIYWVKVGQNIGYEVYGKGKDFLRPVLVVRKFSRDSFLGVPLTSVVKDDMFHFEFIPLNNKKNNYAILSQIKLFSSKRIHDKMSKISVDDFKNLKVKLRKLIDL